MTQQQQRVRRNEKGVFESPFPAPDYDVSKFNSLGECLVSKLEANENGRVFIDAASGRSWTGGQVKEKMLNIACALIDLYDFKRGTSVCIDYNHCDQTVILALGIVCAGGIVSCAYHKDPYAELLYLARKVEPRFLFCHLKNARFAKKLEEDLDFSVQAIAMDEHSESASDLVDHFDALWNYDHQKSKSANRVPVVCVDVEREVAMIILSSGTTGKPKAVPATHSKCIADCFAFARWLGEGVKFACTSSLDYISGRLIIFGAICSGYQAVIIETFEPKLYAELIEKYKINIIYIGAGAFYQFITYKDLDNYDLSSIVEVFPMGAKIIFVDEVKKFFARCPNIRNARQGFGASELAGGAMNSMTPEQYLSDADNCGQLVPGMRAKVVHPESGKLLDYNEQGILHLRGRHSFLGYYDLQQMRAQEREQLTGDGCCKPSPFVIDKTVLDEDGFYITGDLGYFNQKGDLYIVGRYKELMSCRAAKKVLPSELEDIIEQHPCVSKVCVLGITNKKEPTLHCPRAFVVCKRECYIDTELKLSDRLDSSLAVEDGDEGEEEQLVHSGNQTMCKLSDDRRHRIAEDIMRFVDERIGWEKRLTGGVVLLDELPMLRVSVGKIDKGLLRALDTSCIEIYGDRSG